MGNQSLIIRDIKRIIKKSLKRIIVVSIFMSFLFYLLNIFVGLTLKLDNISSTITDKVGIYFYIKEQDKTSDEIFKRVLQIKDELNKNWIRSEFSSKDDAFNYLENKVPDITRNFDKFGIENPLPSTLYIMFNNQKEYNIMKNTILKNKDIILNIKDIEQWSTLVQQENRSLRILKIMDTIKISFYFAVIMLSIIIIFFTQHLLRHFFNNFYEEIEVKKLLWAKYADVNGWFLGVLLFSISLWFLIWIILISITFMLLDHNLNAINVNLNLYNIIPQLFILYVIFCATSLWLWYRMLKQMENKF